MAEPESRCLPCAPTLVASRAAWWPGCAGPPSGLALGLALAVNPLGRQRLEGPTRAMRGVPARWPGRSTQSLLWMRPDYSVPGGTIQRADCSV
jgi:hypothetical protein